jgi:hypothetical protein
MHNASPLLRSESFVNSLTERLKTCCTSWLYLLLTYTDGTHQKIITQNHCGLSCCPAPSCIAHRLIKTKMSLSPYFDAMQHISFVTLTFGKHKAATPALKAEMNRLFVNFIRHLHKQTKRYRGVAIYEIKPKSDGLYHCHIHVAFEYSPHLNTLIKMWSIVNKASFRTDVRYNANRQAILRYFCRRIALAGIGMRPEEYITLLYGKHKFEAFGFGQKKAFLSNLVYIGHNSTSDSRKKIFSVMILREIPKFQCEIEPPLSFDELLAEIT